MTKVGYNERSWAIDLITELNKITEQLDMPIHRVGGEYTISGTSSRLFPDVVLFGDETMGSIMQGWELKFPDTPITDTEFVQNAERKARELGLNSFLIWNVQTARLFINNENDSFVPTHTWNDLIDIDTRQLVESNKKRWKTLARKIIFDLNDFFNRGTLLPVQVNLSLFENGILTSIIEKAAEISDSIREHARKNPFFDADLELWWNTEKDNFHGEKSKYVVASKLVLSGWINKFVFAHILKQYNQASNAVSDIDSDISNAIHIFNNISKKCDFWNVFKPYPAEQCISTRVWDLLLQLNGFLNDLRLEKVTPDILYSILRAIQFISRRKIAGQYATPRPLAELLVYLTVYDKSGMVIDPCCGTGTIARAAYDIKCRAGLSTKEALQTVAAGDKFQFPLQIAALALADPLNMNETMQLYQGDIFDLDNSSKVGFTNPQNGRIELKKVFPVDYVVANLPFVRFETIDIVNERAKDIPSILADITKNDVQIHGKSDLFVYLTLSLWRILKDQGRLGIIVSNSWLGTAFGASFRNILNIFFKFDKVVTSGNGRWFSESKVVSNLIILEKRSLISVKTQTHDPNESIDFVTINKKIDDMADEIKILSNPVISRRKNDALITLNSYNWQTISKLEKAGMPWSAFFSKLDWLFAIHRNLSPVTTFFKVARGQRRGWNSFFYPQGHHGIERPYLRPLLKTPKSADKLIAQADKLAFCCSKSVDDLKSMGHAGALSWIERHQGITNNKGEPFEMILLRGHKYWYENKPDTMADIVAPLNPGDRLFFTLMNKRAFVDQRLITFSFNTNGTDKSLLHALLNTTLSLFFLEAAGFGRGDGALDLSATKIKTHMHILNPKLLNQDEIDGIKEQFKPILQRKIKPILQELDSADRRNFDLAVMKAFRIDEYYESICDALKTLYGIRVSVFQ